MIMYARFLRNRIPKEDTNRIALDPSKLPRFVFQPDDNVLNSGSLFVRDYQLFSTAVKNNNTSGVLNAMRAAFWTVGTMKIWGSLKTGQLANLVVSESYLYFIYKMKQILMNKPDQNPFSMTTIFPMFKSVEYIFNGEKGSLIAERLILITAFANATIDKKRCVIMGNEFIQEYLSSLSLKVNEAKIKEVAELISTVYCGLFSAHQLFHGDIGYILTNLTEFDAIQLKGILHCLSIPLLEYFSFPDGFKENEYHQSLAECAELYANCCILGLRKNYLSSSFCSSLTNAITSRINNIMSLDIPSQNLKMCGNIKNILMKWSF